MRLVSLNLEAQTVTIVHTGTHNLGNTVHQLGDDVMAINKALLYTAALLSTTFLGQPKEWCGIKPLQSTRADVSRLLKLSESSSKADQCGCPQLKEVNIFVLYANGLPCGAPESNDGRVGGWKVPRNTVIEFTVYYKSELRFSALKIDESKLEKETDDHTPGVVNYTDRQEGVRYRLVGGNVQSISYFPAAKDNYLRCP